MLRNLAVGIDAAHGSEVPLQQAIELAGASGARLHLLTALEQNPPDDRSYGLQGPSVVRAALGPAEQEEAPEPHGELPPYLEQARRLCHAAGVPSRLHLHHGDPWPWLMERALVAQALILGRRSRSGGEWLDCGPNLRRLLRDPLAPVLVCSRAPVERRRGLALYEGDPQSARTLHLCAEICVALNIPLNVLACAPRREEAADLLEMARYSLYAYEIFYELHAAVEPPAVALSAMAAEMQPSLLAVPAATGGGWWGRGRHPVCQAALQVPQAAVLFVP